MKWKAINSEADLPTMEGQYLVWIRGPKQYGGMPTIARWPDSPDWWIVNMGFVAYIPKPIPEYKEQTNEPA